MENFFSDNITDDNNAFTDNDGIAVNDDVTTEPEKDITKDIKTKTAAAGKKSRGPHKKSTINDAEPKQNFSVSLPVEIAKTLNVAVAFGDFANVSEAITSALYSCKELKPILELVRERNCTKH